MFAKNLPDKPRVAVSSNIDRNAAKARENRLQWRKRVWVAEGTALLLVLFWSSFDVDVDTRDSFGLHIVALRSQRKVHALVGAVVGSQNQFSDMYTMIHGHESRVLLVLCSFAERSTTKCEGVGLEESWEEARANVGAGLE
jgi:hypothetical protein